MHAPRIVGAASSKEAISSLRSPQMVAPIAPLLLRSRIVTLTRALWIAKVHGLSGAHARTLAGQERSQECMTSRRHQPMAAPPVPRHPSTRNATFNRVLWTAQGLGSSGVHARLLAGLGFILGATRSRRQRRTAERLVQPLQRSRRAISSPARWTATASGVSGACVRRPAGRRRSPGSSLSRRRQPMAALLAQRRSTSKAASCKSAQLTALGPGVS